MKIDVRFDAARATASLSSYHAKIRDKAMARALNRTATTVRAVAARMIAPEVKPLPISEIKKAISIQRAAPGRLVAVVRAGGRRRIPLTMLGARATKTGVTVRVGGKTYTIAHAFLTKVQRSIGGRRMGVKIRAPDFKAQMVDSIKFRGSRRGAMFKAPKRQATIDKHRRDDPDFPIAEIFGPGVPTIFVQEKILRGMRDIAIERFTTVIAQELKFLQSKG